MTTWVADTRLPGSSCSTASRNSRARGLHPHTRTHSHTHSHTYCATGRGLDVRAARSPRMRHQQRHRQRLHVCELQTGISGESCETGHTAIWVGCVFARMGRMCVSECLCVAAAFKSLVQLFMQSSFDTIGRGEVHEWTRSASIDRARPLVYPSPAVP